jgi:hypothetical protein
MRPLNLLNHPGLAQQRRVFHRRWTSLSGVLVGGLLAWGVLEWQIQETQRLQESHSRLKSAWLERTQQNQAAVQQQNQQRLQLTQAAHLQDIVTHQQAWLAVHAHLLSMAEKGLRLSRLQSEAGHAVLHGEVNRFEAMAEARQGLAEQLGQEVSLKEMTTGPASPVSFVWETTWPALHMPPLAAAAMPGKTKP